MARYACIRCTRLFDESEMDLTGLGYRCHTCSLNASIQKDLGQNDVADHLTVDERLKAARRALWHMVLGGGLFAICTAAYLVLPLGWFLLGGAFGLGVLIRGGVIRRHMAGRTTG